MDASVRTRSTRDRPAKAPLSEAAVVEAALKVTRAEGLPAVTMRRVAAELDTGAASLYVYVRNRDDLLRAMLDRVAGEIPLVKPDRGRWRRQLHDILDAFRVALETYPGLATVLPEEPLATDSALATLENLLGLVVAGGIPPQDAAWACDILMLIVTATATEADVRRAAGLHFDDDLVERLRRTFAGMPPDDYPNVVSHADELVAGDGAERFHFAIDVFLDGLVARSARR
ncbi:MAG: TetR/AcrR family transcriptional regulator C-terminal domain-containing protein [Solirubrobacterales bacterium]